MLSSNTNSIRMSDEDEDFIQVEVEGFEEDDEVDDPIQTLILDKASKREEVNSENPGESNDKDDADNDEDEEQANDEGGDLQATNEGTPGTKKRKKKKRKKKRKDTAEQQEVATAGEVSSGKMQKKELQPITTRKVSSHQLPMILAPIGVILVQETDDIARDAEVTKLIKAPRYFDEEVTHIVGSRCFNCGRSGHRAGECTFAPRDKPCFFCAQFGHGAKDCPSQLCFNCGRPGHKSRECTESRSSSWEMGYGQCLRCASSTCACANKADYYRYEGGCTEGFSSKDLKQCKCYVCGKYGHLCCKKTPVLPARVSCYSCGSAKHLGEDCPTESRAHLAAERNGDMGRAQREREEEQEREEAYERARSTRGRQQGRSLRQHDSSTARRGVDGQHRASHRHDNLRDDRSRYHNHERGTGTAKHTSRHTPVAANPMPSDLANFNGYVFGQSVQQQKPKQDQAYGQQAYQSYSYSKQQQRSNQLQPSQTYGQSAPVFGLPYGAVPWTSGINDPYNPYGGAGKR